MSALKQKAARLLVAVVAARHSLARSPRELSAAAELDRPDQTSRGDASEEPRMRLRREVWGQTSNVQLELRGAHFALLARL
eukprot:6896857-Prymnesium_polylepis.1